MIDKRDIINPDTIPALDLETLDIGLDLDDIDTGFNPDAIPAFDLESIDLDFDLPTIKLDKLDV